MLVVLSLNARAVSSMAEGGMLPKPLAKLNKNGVPGTATIVLAIVCMILSCFPSLTELLVNLGSVSAAITIVIVCASLICARKKVPHQAGNYKAPRRKLHFRPDHRADRGVLYPRHLQRRRHHVAVHHHHLRCRRCDHGVLSKEERLNPDNPLLLA